MQMCMGINAVLRSVWIQAAMLPIIPPRAQAPSIRLRAKPQLLRLRMLSRVGPPRVAEGARPNAP